MIFASSKKLGRRLLPQTMPLFGTTSSRKSSAWTEVVLYKPSPILKSYRDYQTLNQMQRNALSAALDLKKPLVTVLGSPGTGKTLLVAEFAHAMYTNMKRRVLVVCGSREIMYGTVGKYFRRANHSGHFVHLQPFDEEAALRIMPNINHFGFSHYPAAREALAKRSLVAMMRQKAQKKDSPIGVVDVLLNEAARDQTRVVFATPEDVFALLEELSARKHSNVSSSVPPPALFDAVVLEDIGALKGSDDWRMFLQLSPLLRVFGDPHHSTCSASDAVASSAPPAAVVSQQTLDSDESTPYQCSLVQQITPSDDFSSNFVLFMQYRSNMNVQIWTGRAFYAPREHEISLARPVSITHHEPRLNHLMDRLVMDNDRVAYTDTLTLVDTGALDGHWRQTMFEPSQMVAGSSAAPSPVNWGEALLAAVHIDSLLSYKIYPYQIACFSHSPAHGEAIRKILFSLNNSLSFDSDCVEIGRVEQYLGRPFEAVVKSFISEDVFAAYFSSQRALHYLSAELTAANRQIFLIGPLQRFRQPRTKEAYEFVNLLKQRGSIITPSELFSLELGQFEHIVREANAAKPFRQSPTEKRKDVNEWRDQRRENHVGGTNNRSRNTRMERHGT